MSDSKDKQTPAMVMWNAYCAITRDDSQEADRLSGLAMLDKGAAKIALDTARNKYFHSDGKITEARRVLDKAKAVYDWRSAEAAVIRKRYLVANACFYMKWNRDVLLTLFTNALDLLVAVRQAAFDGDPCASGKAYEAVVLQCFEIEKEAGRDEYDE